MPPDGYQEYSETREYIYASGMELCDIERRRAKRACSAATLRVRAGRGAIPVKTHPSIFDLLIQPTDIAAEENQPHTPYLLPLSVRFSYARGVSRMPSRGIGISGFAKNITCEKTNLGFLSNRLIKRKEIF